MFNVPALFTRLFVAFLTLCIMVYAVQADTVIQVTLNGYTTGIFGDQINSYQIQLFDNEAPITVANFLNYANSNAYNGTIIHRDVPGFVLQGGGYKLDVNSNNHITGIDPIPTNAPIQNEFSSSRSNVRGTVAMAQVGTDPNSATSQWFVNLADNSSNLDSQNGGFTVFGHVAGEGMELVDAVAGLQTKNFNPLYYPSDVQNGPFAQVPVAYDEVNDPNHINPIFIQVLSTTVISTTAWKGGASASTTDWGAAANWNGSPIPDGKGVNVDIGSQSTANNVIDMISAGRTVGNIYFTPFTSTTIQSTGGKSLTIDNNGKTSLVNVLGNNTISASLILNNNTVFDVNGSLTASGNISGAGSLGITDSGNLTLSGSNTYTGNTLITSGSLTAAKAASLPGYNISGKVTISSGAALIVRAGASSGQWAESEINTLQNTVAFPSGSYLGINTNDGPFTYGASGGVLSGSLSLAKLGNNSLLLAGNNSYTGKTQVVAGALIAGKTASLPGYNASSIIFVDPGATLAVRAGAQSGEWASPDIDALNTNATFYYDNSSSPTVYSYLGIDTTGGNFTYGTALGESQGFNKLGANTLTLTGSNTFTGPVIFSGGLINATTSNNLGAGTELDFNGGGLQFNGVFDPSVRTMSFLADAIIDTQGLPITFANSVGNGGDGGLRKTGSGMLILSASPDYNGATTINAGTLQLASGAVLPTTAVNLTASGAKLDANGISQTIASLTGAAGTEVMLGGSTLTTGSDNTSTTFAGVISSTSGGTLDKTGTGVFTLSASPTYKGGTIVNAGTLQLASGAVLPTTTAVNLTASGAKLDANGISQTIASLTGAAGTEVMLGGSTLTTGSDNTSTAFAGVISSTSGGTLTKTGSGTFTLSGSNTFSGPVNLNGGLINASNLSNLGNGAALNFNGGGLQFNAVFDPSTRTMTFQAGGATLDTQTKNIPMANSIGNSGSGGLTKQGSGILELDGAVTYTGPTTVNAGVLKINNKQSTTLTTISGAGTLEVDGAKTALTAASVNVGTLTIGAGASLTIAPLAGLGLVGNIIPVSDASILVPVPEPNALALLGIAALPMLFAALRKRSKSLSNLD